MEFKKKPYFTSLIVFIFCVSVSIVVTYFVNQNNKKITKQQLEISTTEIKSKIESRLDAYIQFSQSSSSFFMASDSVTRTDWKYYVERSKIVNYLKGFQGIAFISKFSKDQLPNHINRFKKEYSSSYTVFPEIETTEITPITFIEPFDDRNKKAIGFNISSNTNMREALEESRDLNNPILTNKVILIQEGSNSSQPGIVIYAPIYSGNVHSNIEERRKLNIGWAAISLRINDFMQGIIEPYNLGKRNAINLIIFDGNDLDENSILYNANVVLNTDSEIRINTLMSSINLNGKVWTFQFTQANKTFVNSFGFVVLLIGFVISLLLSILVYSLSNTASIAKKIANNLTSDLKDKNEELIKAKELAEESEEQLKLISNNLVNGMIYQVISIDENKRKFTYVSDTVQQLYGCTVEEAKENSDFIYSKIHKDDIEGLVLKEKEAVLEMAIFKAEARVVNPDESIRWSLFVSKPRLLKGEVCWDGIEIDITEQKNIENELIIAKSKAEESNNLKTEFLNNMSHEIRTPMNGILGFTGFLSNPNLSDEKRKNYIQIIQSSGFQLLQIIDDIIEISRLGTKQVRLIESEVCLNDLLLELFSIFDLKAKENKIPLYIKNNVSDLKSTIITDKSKLFKIISNLLENSLKFTKEGFIEFGYNLLENEKIEIYVKDTGIGIAIEKHDLIFERFSQAEKELSKKTGGLGLGLSIVKENVELIGGEIRLESEKGVGASFFITIPYKPVHKEIEKSKNETVLIENYTILIAEDEEVNYLYLETLLNEVLKLECNILHAKNGKEAIELCLKDDAIQLVLMDLKMPIMGGFDAVKEIKKLKPNLIVVAQSAYSAMEEIEKSMAAGFDDFISKPISVANFKKLINKYLGTIFDEKSKD